MRHFIEWCHMYIASILLRNFRCFSDTSIDLNPGLNVLIGENNAGKTAVVAALGLLFARNRRWRPSIHDFNKGLVPSDTPPDIKVAAVLSSSSHDTLEDKALVATWLTKLESPWNARLTYRFFLPDEHLNEFRTWLGSNPDRERYLAAVERLLPKYIARIYGGPEDNLLQAEPDLLARFDFHFLDAVRDVEAEMYAGSTPLMRSMLRQVLDADIPDDTEEQAKRREKFRRRSSVLHKRLRGRLDVDRLFELVEDTGATDGGKPELAGQIDEDDLIAAIRLFIARPDVTVPATHNGLGYNNLIYISLLLASLDLGADEKHLGQNAVLFPILAIEEPEAHLHPALQYKLLKYIKKRLDPPGRSRQVFLTTHSTQITAAAGLDPIVSLSAPGDDAQIHVAYPGRVFGTDAAGKASKKHVERYLDATKSNMLFVKGLILAEGLAELLLIPCFAEYIGVPLEDHHVAVVTVDGVTFKHFLPLFGVCSQDRRPFALRRPVACLIDADPTRKKKAAKKPRHQACWPYELDADTGTYEYRARSFTVDVLKQLCNGIDNVSLYHGVKTLEYDLALENSRSTVLISPELAGRADLRRLAKKSEDADAALARLLAERQDTLTALQQISIDDDRQKAQFATCYLLSVDGKKGERAFELLQRLRSNLPRKKLPLVVPGHIHDAIRWACRIPVTGG